MQSTEQKLREALQALLEESIHESMATANARSALALPTAVPVGDLPELPEPTWSTGLGVAFTADQMRAYARAALSAGDTKDAKRYRWLREQSDDDFAFAVVKNPHFDVYESPEELDSAIDTAIREAQP